LSLDGDSADPARNSALANAIARAKANDVPKANIQAALEQAMNSKGGGSALLEYEALFGGKVGMIIECLSDNSNRTVRELKAICKKHEYVPSCIRLDLLSYVEAQGTDGSCIIHV
ncbi:hypothetical protein M422DRAFT_252360, partial [Sphaerobolus stellatus SS14]